MDLLDLTLAPLHYAYILTYYTYILTVWNSWPPAEGSQLLYTTSCGRLWGVDIVARWGPYTIVLVWSPRDTDF